ncbi:MAG: ATP-grasp fold amidoligase family protein [Anaerostipes sp.]|nr:ATP-grasp fold amidoligase family protein [Anaerostipes sp.]
MNTITKNIILTPFNLLYKISPAFELKLMFKLKQGYSLDLKNPITFNQKLQWIKLYDKNKWMPKCCDKYAVREFVDKMGCSELLNVLYWQGTNPDDIPYDTLPDKFVIKVTHGSTFNIIVTDKEKLDKNETKKKLNNWLKAKFIPCYGEWFYGKIPPKIIIEQYLQDGNSDDLIDYKIFCFNGKAKLIDVHSGRFGTHERNIYDTKWNFMEDVYFKYKHFEGIEKPKVLDDLIRYAEILSKEFNHARVDFFVVDNKIYFGEITFTNGAGFDCIKPYEFDVKMGSWLNLN